MIVGLCAGTARGSATSCSSALPVSPAAGRAVEEPGGDRHARAAVPGRMAAGAGPAIDRHAGPARRHRRGIRCGRSAAPPGRRSTSTVQVPAGAPADSVTGRCSEAPSGRAPATALANTCHSAASPAAAPGCRPARRRHRAAAPSPAPSRPGGRCRGRARRRRRAAPDAGAPARRGRTGRRRRRSRSSAAKSLSAPKACSAAGASGPSPSQQRGGEAGDAVGVGRRPRPGCRCCAASSRSFTPGAAARRHSARTCTVSPSAPRQTVGPGRCAG